MTLCFELVGLRRGPAAAAVSPAWLLVAEGRVVHASGGPPSRPPEGWEVLSGGWAVEPLADAHVHLHLSGEVRREDRRAVSSLGREEALERVLGLLEGYRRRGIAAVRDGGDPHGLVLAAARIANQRPERYAAVLPAGRPVRRAGHYGGFLAPGVENVGQALRRLEEDRSAGATHVKILATGVNSLEDPGAVGPAQFSRPELERLVREARAVGLASMVHANGPLAAVLPSVPDTVEHAFWLQHRDLEVMAEQGTGWVPTLGAWAAFDRDPELTAPQRAVVCATDRRHREEVGEGSALGVKVLAGSDAGTPGVPHGAGLLSELGSLAAAGVSPERVLAAATWEARTLCERELGRTVGGLAEGGVAGFLWVADDPAEDLSVLKEPWGVCLGGRWSRPPCVRKGLE